MPKQLKCKRHPLYKAVRPPRTCTTCWSIFIKKNPLKKISDLTVEQATTVLMHCGFRG